jgi:hypothetical protein
MSDEECETKTEDSDIAIISVGKQSESRPLVSMSDECI